MVVIEGDATHNDALQAAGIDRARALVACVTDDADNLVIVLSARSLAPKLHIVSRASEVEWEEKLRLAGADRVVAPQVVGSERLAAMAVERNLADVFDVVIGGRTLEFVVEEVLVSLRKRAGWNHHSRHGAQRNEWGHGARGRRPITEDVDYPDTRPRHRERSDRDPGGDPRPGREGRRSCSDPPSAESSDFSTGFSTEVVDNA